MLLPEEGTQNQFTLPRELELMLAQVLLQCLHFLYMGICQDGPPMWGPLKTKLVDRSRGCTRAGVEGKN